MSISLPKDMTELELLSFKIVDIKATFREILACDAQGKVYHCDLNYSQTLKRYSKDTQRVVGSAHKIKISRGTHLFFQTGFNPEHCKILECPEEMETLEENLVTIKLCNEYGMETYLDERTIENLQRTIPVSIVINNSPEQIQVDHEGSYDYKEIKQFKDEDGLLINAQGTYNTTIFKSEY